MRSLTEERDKIEVYIAFGATASFKSPFSELTSGQRTEACLPIAREALRLALLPTINQMSVIGLISIPGMMSGAILGGESVEQAARLQMVCSLDSS
jgi:ABC-type iron transport system FetAB permease component